MRSVILLVAISGFILASLSIGFCADPAPTKAPGLLEPSITAKFADIPVPTGFKFLPRESYTFESAGVRVGVLKYIGRATPEEAVSFFKEQMPMYNWSLLNVIEYGERLLNFDRETETCIINISQKGGSTIVTISLGPKSQSLPPSGSDKPIK